MSCSQNETRMRLDEQYQTCFCYTRPKTQKEWNCENEKNEHLVVNLHVIKSHEHPAMINDNFFILNANELRLIWFLLQYIKGLKEILHVKEYECRCNFGYLWPRVWLALLVLLEFVQLCTLDLRSRYDWPKSPWASTRKIYLQHSLELELKMTIGWSPVTNHALLRLTIKNHSVQK